MTHQTAHRPILRHLRQLLWGVTLPLVLLIGVQSYLDYRQASRNAEGYVQSQAATVAYEVSQFLAATERELELMAKRPGVLLMDPLRCDPGLGDLIALQPRYANVTVIDPRGALICGARMPASGLPPVNLSDGEGFRAVMAGQSFVLGPVRRGSIVGRWVLSALVPVRGADGSVSGVLAVVIDLTRWPLRAPSKELSEDAVQGVLDRTGTILLRSPDAEKWVGHNSGNSQITADMLRVGEGTFVSKGVQGFDRFWAVQPIAGTTWMAYAGVRADAVRGAPLRQAATSAAVILCVLLAGWWLAIQASRRLTAPIAQLARVAGRAGEGDLAVRADLASGPAEIVSVAREFNRMLEQRGSAEAALRASEQWFRDTFRLMPASLTLQTQDGVVVDCSDDFCLATGYAREEVVGHNTLELDLWAEPAQRVALRQAVQRDGQVDGFEFLLRHRSGSTRFMQMSARYLTIGGERLLLSFAHDVSKRRRLEMAHRESELQLRLVIRGGDIGFWDWDLASDGLVVNERWLTMLGLDPQGQAPGMALWRSLVHPEDVPTLARVFEALVLDPAGQDGEVEIRARHSAGHYIWILDKFTFVGRTADGRPLRAVGTHMDITERKHAELALQATLRDKEALLKEVHHRVKNNLQVVSSLLRLEAGRSSHAKTQSVLAEMQGRIRAMALLHESIYRSGTFAAIDLAAYLRQVATQAMRSLQTAGGSAQIRLRLNLGSVQVGLDQATPCGLLLTELVSNALKHAFPAGAGGEVFIELQPLPGGAAQEWCLRVSDNGVGLPADFAARQQDSLGLQLVASLAMQLGGHLVAGADGIAAAASAAASVAAPMASSRGSVFSVTFAITVPTPLATTA
jgi:PAS domain S-box-containing protein